MRRLLVIWLLLLFVIGMAEESKGSLAFNSGDNFIGFGLNLDYDIDFAPGIGVLYDHGAINNMISFGGEIDMAFYEYGFYIVPAFRVGFHPFGLQPLAGKISIANVLDPYVVAHAGPRIYLGEWSDWHGYGPGFNFGVDVGVRFMFSPNFGVMAEGDWNNALIGMVFKF